MGRISDEDIRKVREASDIVSIVGERTPVRQRGRDFWCCCPFHQEKTPSCKIDPSTQLWHCFGCGEGGDIFGFIMKMDDISFPDAVRALAERAHIDIVETGGTGVSSSLKARLRQVCKETEAFYHTQLMRGKSQDAAAAREYLAKRGMGGTVPKDWTLGFAPGRRALVDHLRKSGFSPDEMIEANVAIQRQGSQLNDRFYNRVMFPIHDAQGECIAFGGRVIGDGEPKYLNSQETPLFHKSSVLYGLDKAKGMMTSTGTAIVVEGYTDVIALHESGICNAVATLGTALTLQHIRLLSRHASRRIVYLFDGDNAGQRAADRALSFINEDMTPEAGRSRVELCAVTLPDDLDPADFVAAHGAGKLQELVADAKPLLQYGIDRRLAAHDLSTAEGRIRAFSDALSVLAPIKDSLLAKDYAVALGGKLQMREDDVLESLAALKPKPSYAEQDSAAHVQETAPQPRIRLTEGEKSRRRIERRLLSLLAQNPAAALENAAALASTKWHDPDNAAMAALILKTLEEEPGIGAADLIARVSQQAPQASGALTSGLSDNEELGEAVAFLVEELEIGDLEQEVSSMNAQLKDGSGLSPEEHDLIFHMLVDMQNTLNAKRASHRPKLQ